MKHRMNPKTCVWEESIIRLLFTLLLFLSILRVIDMLPDANLVATPAFSETAPAQTVPMDEIDTPTPIEDVDIELFSRGLDLRGQDPKILIYHTHSTEAYTATASSPYVQTGSFRTADPSKSVLAVGEALAQRLRIQYGFSVIHDTTDHEPPSLKTAYERSEKTMRRYLEKHPSLILFIDIHRDASSDEKDYVMVDETPTARLMCVVGQGIKYADKPDFDRNFALATSLTDNLRHIDKRLARDVRVKTGRYNQHIGQLSLLIEVGHNANTLEQALHAVPSLAESLALTLAETTVAGASEEAQNAFIRLLVPQGAGIDKE